MKSRFKSLVGLAFVFVFATQNMAMADPITLVFDSTPNRNIDGTNTPIAGDIQNGDDDSFLLQGVQMNFDGTNYSEVYFSTNSVLSFGNGDETWNSFPLTPSISFAGNDWTIDYNGASADEYLTADRTGNIITLTIAGRLYPDNGVGVTAALNTIVIRIDTSSGTSYSYSLNGASGSDYSLTGNRAGVRLSNGDIIAISALNARSVRNNANMLKLLSRPVISQSANSLICTPGTYSFLDMGATEQASKVSAFVYTLYIDGKPVSRLGSGNYSSIPSQFFPAIPQSVKGTADLNGASWDVSSLKDFTARCEVYAWQNGANMQSASDELADSAKLAAIAASKTARDVERATATAANFSAEARAARKRAAARS